MNSILQTSSRDVIRVQLASPPPWLPTQTYTTNPKKQPSCSGMSEKRWVKQVLLTEGLSGISNMLMCVMNLQMGNLWKRFFLSWSLLDMSLDARVLQPRLEETLPYTFSAQPLPQVNVWWAFWCQLIRKVFPHHLGWSGHPSLCHHPVLSSYNAYHNLIWRFFFPLHVCCFFTLECKI